MTISANTLVQNHKELFTEQPQGNVEAQAHFVTPPDIGEPGALTFVSKPEQLVAAIKNQSTIIIASSEAAKNLTINLNNQCLLVVKNVQQSMTYVLPYFNKKNSRLNQTPHIHPTAIISPSAQIGKNTTIGSNVFIGENVKIGDDVFIGANTVVETFAKIGRGTVLHPLVFVGAYCEIGSHCEIHPHTTIGSDGYGYAPDLKGQIQKIPQIGNVVIEDHVEIGSGCAIDRATLTSTRIGMGTKLDNLCHIAHNVEIGKGCFLTALFSIAGSSKVGDYCTFGGRAAVGDHVTLGNKITIAGDSIAMKDVEGPGAYGGYPLQPMRSYLKTQATILQLTEMRKDLNKVLKQLNIETES